MDVQGVLSSQWAGPVMGLCIALMVWTVTKWRALTLDWKGEVKALVMPSAGVAAAMLFAGVDYEKVAWAVITSFGVAFGLNRGKPAAQVEQVRVTVLADESDPSKGTIVGWVDPRDLEGE